MSIVPLHRTHSIDVGRESSEKVVQVERELDVQKVSIFAEDGPNGKSNFSILLEFDTGSDPSNLSRRTEMITGLALAVEEKEIPVLARLAGRRVNIFLWKSTNQSKSEQQFQTILDQQKQIWDLELRCSTLGEQLQFANEAIHKIS